MLQDIDAFVFDLFGTTADWFTTIAREIARNGLDSDEAEGLARAWRQGYYDHIRHVNAGGEGSLCLDQVHREILDRLLASSPRWSHLAADWDDAVRTALVQAWHRLDYYDDVRPGLAALADSALVVILSNGNFRLLLDVAKHNQTPWHGILSAEFFGVYKPTTKAYLSASYHLGIPPERIAMVAAHMWDLVGAAQAGFKTIYVPRPAVDTDHIRNSTRSKAEGGTVDLVVRDFNHLAVLVAAARSDS